VSVAPLQNPRLLTLLAISILIPTDYLQIKRKLDIIVFFRNNREVPSQIKGLQGRDSR
jgi:predicted CoA-binding protein